MAEIAAYSFENEVDLIVDGEEVTGWAEGEDVVKIDRLEQGFNHVIGAAGDGAVWQSSNKSGSFVFKLFQHSVTNKFLSDKYAAAEAGNFELFETLLKDLAGGDLAIGSSCYIPKPGVMQRGQGIATVEWTIVSMKLDLLHGTNS